VKVRAQLAIAADQGYIGRAEYGRLHDLARRVSGILSNFIAYLQKSGYRGEKYVRPGLRVATCEGCGRFEGRGEF
jgi:hypothetical protein